MSETAVPSPGAPPAGSLVAVAMSGGVDSSVAALLLQRAGYRTVGMTMKLWSPEPECGEGREGGDAGDKSCCTVDSAFDAKRVCDRLGIPHFTLDMRADFEELVVEPFYRTYLEGGTPNPCVNCNSFVKWEALWKRARAVGAAALATGHYATTELEAGHTYIRRSPDARKDQSYFLWGIPPATLSHTLFPLEGLDKPRVRELAREAGLRTAEKAESMDICFLPKGDYRAHLERRARDLGLPFAPGDILGPDGAVLGRHQGLPHYTVGQRRGVGVAAGESLYVKRLDRERNAVELGRREDLYCRGFRAGGANFFGPPFLEAECAVQVRYRSQPRPCLVRCEGNGQVTVELREPAYCVVPGQSAVFYLGDRVLGGARISGAD